MVLIAKQSRSDEGHGTARAARCLHAYTMGAAGQVSGCMLMHGVLALHGQLMLCLEKEWLLGAQ